jgi:hypothetical protein
MDISAKAADPNSQNGERESMLAIAKVSVLFGLFGQCSSAESLRDYALRDRLDATRVNKRRKPQNQNLTFLILNKYQNVDERFNEFVGIGPAIREGGRRAGG